MTVPVTFLHPMRRTCEHVLCFQGCESQFDRWVFHVTSMGAPLQIDGKGHGFAFYFRARHDVWRLELDNEKIAEGDTDDFTVATAVDLIMKTINEWVWAKA